MTRRELVSLSLYSLLSSNRGGLFIIYFPLYLVAVKGAPLPLALAVLSFAWVPASLLFPVFGRISDRIGRRRPFLLAAEIGAFPLFIGVILAPGYLVSSAFFIAAEIALAIGGPALTAYVADVTRENERGLGYGILNAASNGGSAAGFVAAGIVTYVYGLSALFPFVLAVMVGTLSVVLFLVPDGRVRPSPKSPTWTEMRPVAVFSVAVSIRAIGSGAVATFVGVLAVMLGANDLEVGIVAIAGLATAALVSLPLGRYVDRRGEIRSIWYGTVMTLGSFVVLFVAPSWPYLLPGTAIRLAGLSLVGPGMQAWVARVSPPEHRAYYQGLFGMINSTMWSVGPLIGGVTLEYGGLDAFFGMAFVTTIISIVVMTILYQETGWSGGRFWRRSSPIAPAIMVPPPADPAAAPHVA